MTSTNERYDCALNHQHSIEMGCKVIVDSVATTGTANEHTQADRERAVRLSMGKASKAQLEAALLHEFAAIRASAYRDAAEMAEAECDLVLTSTDPQQRCGLWENEFEWEPDDWCGACRVAATLRAKAQG